MDTVGYYLDKIAAWVSQHRGQTHTVAAAIVSAGVAYASSPDVQRVVNGIVGPHPRLLGAVAGVSALILLYHQPQTQEMQAQQAQNKQDQQDHREQQAQQHSI